MTMYGVCMPASVINIAHTVRVPEYLWNAALERAAREDETVSAVIRRALRQYTNPDNK
jgi:hypothetical protein